MNAPTANPGAAGRGRHIQWKHHVGLHGWRETFTVPPCVSSLSVDLRGGQGGTGSAGAGDWGQVSGELAVYPGQELYVYVGGQATATGNNAPVAGMEVEMPPRVPAQAGGGASDIRTIGGSWDDPASE